MTGSRGGGTDEWLDALLVNGWMILVNGLANGGMSGFLNDALLVVDK